MLRNALFVVGLVAAAGCRPSLHPVEPATLGEPVEGSFDLQVDRPGPVRVETIAAADWAVPLRGLLNLGHEDAEAAGLKNRVEPIQVYFHALRHPEHGLFLVDTGIEAALRDDPKHAAVRGLAAKILHTDDMTIHQDTASWIAAQDEPVQGVFLTHLHIDHVSGMPDVPPQTPVYLGPGETEARGFGYGASRPTFNRALQDVGALQEWQFQPDPDGRFAGVLDVFGDGSVWALHVPGHTPGSTAYLVRTPEGPVLLTGDASHTAWGWEHSVEPGTFSHDLDQSAQSLDQLRALAEAHPGMDVRVGHQPLSQLP